MNTYHKGEWKLEVFDEQELGKVESLLADFIQDVKQTTLYQSKEWASFLRWLLGNKRTYIFLLYNKDTLVLGSYAFSYPLLRKLSWLYFPRGPVIAEGEQIEELMTVVYQLLGRDFKKQFVWVRFDPLLQKVAENRLVKKAHAAFHPRSTLLLDLTLSEEELLQQMKQKGRYNIRLAEKKGVEIEIYAGDQLQSQEGMDLVQEFYTITVETTARDGFSGHSLEYYRTLIATLGTKSLLTVAKYENSIIAAGIFTLHEGVCTYYYGASSNMHRQVMAPYLLQWKTIQYAKQQGMRTYDFLGINDEGKQSTGASLDGVTDFKLKFGGNVVSHAGTFEIIVRPFWYFVVRFAKFLRSFHQK